MVKNIPTDQEHNCFPLNACISNSREALRVFLGCEVDGRFCSSSATADQVTFPTSFPSHLCSVSFRPAHPPYFPFSHATFSHAELLNFDGMCFQEHAPTCPSRQNATTPKAVTYPS